MENEADVRKVDYHGYTIYEDGRIIGLHGREVKKRLHNGRYEVRLNLQGKRRNFLASRLIYYVFHPFDIDDKNLCVSFRDGDKRNIHLSNLFKIHRKELIQGEKHTKRSTLTDEEAEEIRQLYKGKSGSNLSDKTSLSYQDIADMYGVTKSNIMHIVLRKSRDAEQYRLK